GSHRSVRTRAPWTHPRPITRPLPQHREHRTETRPLQCVPRPTVRPSPTEVNRHYREGLHSCPAGRTVRHQETESVCGTDDKGGRMTPVPGRSLRGHAAQDAAPRQQKEHRDVRQVTFPDLTWDHFYWEQQKRTGESDHPEAARRYRKTRAAFEDRYGEI